MRSRAFVAIALVCLALAGYWLAAQGGGACVRHRRESERPVGLLLYCGAGIRPGVEAVIAAFQDEHDIRVDVTYGGSGQQLGQISAIESGDLFMPGADFYLETAIERGMADPETARTVGYFVPVIFVQKGNPLGINTLRDLLKDGVRVGLGDPRACAVGRNSLEILEKSGIPYPEIGPNVIVKSGTVNELALAIRLGSLDAAIIWDANARQFAGHGETIRIPPERNDIATVPIARLRYSQHPEESMRFIEFVTSSQGRSLLEAKGYTVSLSDE
ncbi:MAG: molybdate ABC transporter substrate-binding protein [Candidatus Brocadiia bacterium]